MEETLSTTATDKKEKESIDFSEKKSAKLCSLKPKLLYNLTLVVILIFYGIFGGFVFKTFETTTYEVLQAESQTREVIISKDELLNDLWEAQNNNEAPLTYKEWSNRANSKLDMFLASQARDAEIHSGTVHWGFADSWLFACTVFTTVGYGNITPLSIKARLFCMLYGAIGIPLFSVVAGSLVAFINEAIQVIHEEYHKRKLLKLLEKHKKYDDTKPMDLIMPHLKIGLKHMAMAVMGYLSIGAVFFSFCEGWSLFEAFYYCFITLSTVGLGDYVPQHIHHTVSFGGYILVGLVLVIMLFGALEEVIENHLRKIKAKMGIDE